ncbi:MAG: dTMP kinase, partial [Firmicutes bacterium]|nr:dTMP kinase [Bacillota bacterium]
PIGEAIRSVILNPKYTEMDQMTEAMLYAASRAQHVAEKIKPAMAEGYIVLLDRFLDSSLVYQGIARGMTIETIEAINQFATGGLQPDATIMVYIDYEEGLRRKKAQNGSLDRMEAQQDNFHRRVNEGYLQLAHRYPERIQLIDGARDPQTIHQDILKRVQDLVHARN